MKREELQNKKHEGELISFFSCNGTTIDSVSGVELTRTNVGENTYYTNPIYVEDPKNTGIYAVKKANGQKYLTPNVRIYDTDSMFKYPHTSDAEGIRFVRKNHCSVEFDVYIDPSTTNRVIYNDGDVECAGGNNGVGLWIYNENLCVRYANNGSSQTNVLATIGSVKEEWFHVVVEYIPSNWQCEVHISVYGNKGIYTSSVSLNPPTSNNTRNCILAGSHYSYYSGAQDTVDLFKNIAFWKL